MPKYARAKEVAEELNVEAVYADPAEFERILDVYLRYPLSSLIIHPRVQKEFYKGDVHREIFAAAAERLAASGRNTSLIFNGNIATAEEAASLAKDFPGLSGVMLGRGMLTDPMLALKTKALMAAKDFSSRKETPVLTMEAFASFHEDLVRRNSEVLSGSHQVLHRLKEFWPYWYVNFTNGVKYWKRVRKARYYSDYEEAVCELFQKEEIIPGACFEAYSIR